MASGPKKIIGLFEDVVVVGTRDKAKAKAKVDTGTSRSAVDLKIAARVGLGPITSTVKVKSSTARRAVRRPLAQATIIIADVKFDIPVSIVDRRGMKSPVLIGMDILKSGIFLINPSKF